MRGRTTHRAFSLAEVMLAMFILGVGIVAVASLFPAGIAQQRQSADDIIGVIVADNAISLLRSKVRPQDFGTFEEFGTPPNNVAHFTSDTTLVPATLPGDWPWRRPGFYLQSRTINLPNGTMINVRPGDICLFDHTPNVGEAFSEVPWNSFLHGANGPLVIVSQRERYYPMQANSAVSPARAEYVWDCMFRRFQGQILVAIFVYRVSSPGGGAAPWAVPYSISDPTVPPLPVDRELPQWWSATGPDPTNPRDDAEIPGTSPGTTYNPSNIAQNWQAPGQWLLDQNNNIIRILSGRRSQDDGPVEMVRPIPPAVRPFAAPTGNYLGGPYFYKFNPPGGTTGVDDVVNRIWYLPSEVTLDVDGNMQPDSFELKVTLTPVYICVRPL